MERSMTIALVLVAAIPLAAGPAPGEGLAPPAGSAEREIEALRARVADLEKAVSGGAAAPRTESPSPVASQPSSATVSTASARDAGSRAVVGAGNAEDTKVLLDLIRRRNGPALSRELGRLLSQGDAARPTLFDFLSELDRDSREALLLSYDYRFSFSLVHLAVLHPDELARIAHYFLAASENSPRSTLRRTLFDFLPVFLRYHRGRYPDLERDLEQRILQRLTERKGDLQMYYGAMESLGYKPPIEVFEPLLEAASSHAETRPVVTHLEYRNDLAAVRILSRAIDRNPQGMEWKSAIMFGSLARMPSPEAEKALSAFVHHPDESLRVPAARAYFSVPRNERSLLLLRDFLGIDGDLEKKRLIIHSLRRSNPALLEALKKESDKLRSEEVRKLLANEELPPGAPKPAR